MNKIIGRTLGFVIAVGIFLLGLWAMNRSWGMNHYGDSWVLTASVIAVVAGAGLLQAVTSTIGKDMEQWGNMK